MRSVGGPVIALTIVLAFLAGGRALSGEAWRYEDPALGFTVELPDGWKAHRLQPAGGDAWVLGFASPASLRNAREKAQPVDNPRYQDVLVARIRADPFAVIAAQYCRSAGGTTAVTDRTIGGVAAIECSGMRAVGGDVQLLVETRDVFIRLPDGVLHFSAEAKGRSLAPERAEGLHRVLAGFRVLARPGSGAPESPRP